MDANEFWNKKHAKYANQDWIRMPTIFAEEVCNYLPADGRILDLGCGQGQDTIYFAERGYSVVAVDFSEYALSQVQELVRGRNYESRVSLVPHNLRFALPFDDDSFEVAYAHLSLHYFSDVETHAIFRDIGRVLRRDALLCVLVNSVDDPECGKGKQIEESYYEVSDGDYKRYFSRRYMHKVSKDYFVPYILSDKGRTHKDPTDAFIKLIATRI